MRREPVELYGGVYRVPASAIDLKLLGGDIKEAIKEEAKKKAAETPAFASRAMGSTLSRKATKSDLHRLCPSSLSDVDTGAVGGRIRGADKRLHLVQLLGEDFVAHLQPRELAAPLVTAAGTPIVGETLTIATVCEVFIPDDDYASRGFEGYRGVTANRGRVRLRGAHEARDAAYARSLQQRPPPAPSDEGWTTYTDPETGHAYDYNAQTGQSRWATPESDEPPPPPRNPFAY